MALGDILDVQQGTHNATTNTLALPAFAVNPSNGDTIIVAYSVWTNIGLQLAPTDSAGNTYTQVGTEVSNGVPEVLGLWYAHNITGGSSFVVTGHLVSNQYHTAIAWLISGDFTYNSDFKSAGGHGGSNPLSTGTTSPAPSGEAIFLGAMTYDTSTAATDGSGWNDTASHGFNATLQGRARQTSFSTIDLYTEYKVSTSTAEAATWGISSSGHDYNALVASFGSSSPDIDISTLPAIATWTLPSATLTAGAATITVAAPAIATWTVPLASITGSSIALSASPAIATWTNPDATLTLGTGTIAASPAVMTWTFPAATIATGTISFLAPPAIATWHLPTATLIASSPSVSGVAQYTTNRLFVAPAAASGVSLTPNATPWNNSAWFEIEDVTDAAWLLTGIVVRPPNLAEFEMFEVDIGVGAAAAEVVVTTFRGTFNSTTYASPGILPAPIPLDHIGSGVRVSARIRKSGANTTAWTVAVQFYKKPLIGVLLTSARPQLVYPSAADDIALTLGASPWVSSTYTELVASTSSAIVVVGIIISTGGLNSRWEVDLATGAAASESVVQTVRSYHTGIQFTDGPNFVPFSRPLDNIPASARISARSRMSTISGSMSVFVALVYVEKPL